MDGKGNTLAPTTGELEVYVPIEQSKFYPLGVHAYADCTEWVESALSGFWQL